MKAILADIKTRLFDHWHSTLAGCVILLLAAIITLICFGYVSAEQVVRWTDAASKTLTLAAAFIGALALILSKSGNTVTAEQAEAILSDFRTAMLAASDGAVALRTGVETFEDSQPDSPLAKLRAGANAVETCIDALADDQPAAPAEHAQG